MTSRTLPGFSLRMNARLTRAITAAVLIALHFSTNIGCGRQTSPTAPTVPTSAPSIPPIAGTTTDTVPAANNGQVGVHRSDMTISHSGTATVTLRWPNADFSLQLFVTRGVCVDAASLVTGGCTILGSTRPGSLPGVVTSPVTAGDLNTIWVLNTDPAPQGFSVDVNIE